MFLSVCLCSRVNFDLAVALLPLDAICLFQVKLSEEELAEILKGSNTTK